MCPRRCRLAEGATGFCRARRAQGGAVVCANYGRITSIALDPIEKKPLAFFRPGRNILSYRWLPQAMIPCARRNMRMMRESFAPVAGAARATAGLRASAAART